MSINILNRVVKYTLVGIVALSLSLAVSLVKPNVSNAEELEKPVATYSDIVTPFSDSVKYCSGSQFNENSGIDKKYDNCKTLQNYYDISFELLRLSNFVGKSADLKNVQEQIQTLNDSVSKVGVETKTPTADKFPDSETFYGVPNDQFSQASIDTYTKQIELYTLLAQSSLGLNLLYKDAETLQMQHFNIFDSAQKLGHNFDEENWFTNCAKDVEQPAVESAEKEAAARNQVPENLQGNETNSCLYLWAKLAIESPNGIEFQKDAKGNQRNDEDIQTAALQKASEVQELEQKAVQSTLDSASNLEKIADIAEALPLIESMLLTVNFDYATLTDEQMDSLVKVGFDYQALAQARDMAKVGLQEVASKFTLATDARGIKLTASLIGDCASSQNTINSTDAANFADCYGSTSDEKFRTATFDIAAKDSVRNIPSIDYIGDTNADFTDSIRSLVDNSKSNPTYIKPRTLEFDSALKDFNIKDFKAPVWYKNSRLEYKFQTTTSGNGAYARRAGEITDYNSVSDINSHTYFLANKDDSLEKGCLLSNPNCAKTAVDGDLTEISINLTGNFAKAYFVEYDSKITSRDDISGENTQLIAKGKDSEWVTLNNANRFDFFFSPKQDAIKAIDVENDAWQTSQTNSSADPLLIGSTAQNATPIQNISAATNTFSGDVLSMGTFSNTGVQYAQDEKGVASYSYGNLYAPENNGIASQDNEHTKLLFAQDVNYKQSGNGCTSSSSLIQPEKGIEGCYFKDPYNKRILGNANYQGSHNDEVITSEYDGVYSFGSKYTGYEAMDRKLAKLTQVSYKLTGEIANNFSIWYSVYQGATPETRSWSNVVKDGMMAGDLDNEIYAIQIYLTPKSADSAPIVTVKGMAWTNDIKATTHPQIAYMNPGDKTWSRTTCGGWKAAGEKVKVEDIATGCGANGSIKNGTVLMFGTSVYDGTIDNDHTYAWTEPFVYDSNSGKTVGYASYGNIIGKNNYSEKGAVKVFDYDDFEIVTRSGGPLENISKNIVNTIVGQFMTFMGPIMMVAGFAVEIASAGAASPLVVAILGAISIAIQIGAIIMMIASIAVMFEQAIHPNISTVVYQNLPTERAFDGKEYPVIRGFSWGNYGMYYACPFISYETESGSKGDLSFSSAKHCGYGNYREFVTPAGSGDRQGHSEDESKMTVIPNGSLITLSVAPGQRKTSQKFIYQSYSNNFAGFLSTGSVASRGLDLVAFGPSLRVQSAIRSYATEASTGFVNIMVQTFLNIAFIAISVAGVVGAVKGLLELRTQIRDYVYNDVSHIPLLERMHQQARTVTREILNIRREYQVARGALIEHIQQNEGFDLGPYFESIVDQTGRAHPEIVGTGVQLPDLTDYPVIPRVGEGRIQIQHYGITALPDGTPAAGGFDWYLSSEPVVQAMGEPRIAARMSRECNENFAIAIERAIETRTGRPLADVHATYGDAIRRFTDETFRLNRQLLYTDLRMNFLNFYAEVENVFGENNRFSNMFRYNGNGEQSMLMLVDQGDFFVAQAYDYSVQTLYETDIPNVSVRVQEFWRTANRRVANFIVQYRNSIYKIARLTLAATAAVSVADALTASLIKVQRVTPTYTSDYHPEVLIDYAAGYYEANGDGNFESLTPQDGKSAEDTRNPGNIAILGNVIRQVLHPDDAHDYLHNRVDEQYRSLKDQLESKKDANGQPITAARLAEIKQQLDKMELQDRQIAVSTVLEDYFAKFGVAFGVNNAALANQINDIIVKVTADKDKDITTNLQNLVSAYSTELAPQSFNATSSTVLDLLKVEEAISNDAKTNDAKTNDKANDETANDEIIRLTNSNFSKTVEVKFSESQAVGFYSQTTTEKPDDKEQARVMTYEQIVANNSEKGFLVAKSFFDKHSDLIANSSKFMIVNDSVLVNGAKFVEIKVNDQSFSLQKDEQGNSNLNDNSQESLTDQEKEFINLILNGTEFIDGLNTHSEINPIDKLFGTRKMNEYLKQLVDPNYSKVSPEDVQESEFDKFAKDANYNGTIQCESEDKADGKGVYNCAIINSSDSKATYQVKRYSESETESFNDEEKYTVEKNSYQIIKRHINKYLYKTYKTYTEEDDDSEDGVAYECREGELIPNDTRCLLANGTLVDAEVYQKTISVEQINEVWKFDTLLEAKLLG